MGEPSRLRWLAATLTVIAAFVATAAPLLASGKPASAMAAAATGLQVARLDADPVPLQVLEGQFDERFVAADAPVIRETGSSPRWWRITAGHDILAADDPQLVLQSPHLAQVEAWTPGRAMPLQRALIGEHADPRYSTRALVVPLARGLRAGQPVYLRVHARGMASMPVAIEPLAAVHRADLQHVAWRTLALVSLLLLSVLALGFRVGVGERGYAWLSLTLLAQCAFLASSGGEIRLLPWLAGALGNDIRIVRLFGLIATVSGLVFLGHYLDLRARQPRLVRILDGCNLVLAGLIVATLASSSRLVAVFGNLVLLAAAITVLVATVVAVGQRQRAAYFLLIAWLPTTALLVLRVGELLGGWVNPAWMNYALPVALPLSGLVITIGLSDALQQLRRDHDRASRQATYDGLTDALTRPAIEQRLKTAVETAHDSGRPLAVVFFDIDRFKRINDDYGHRAGDACLRIISLRTRNRLRTYDLIGRWGGDEMIVVLPDTRLGEALGVAENLRSAVNCRPLSIDGNLFDASLSLGVAELAAGESAEHLLERADSALYSSKQAGRDRVTGHDPRVTGNHPRFVASSKSGA